MNLAKFEPLFLRMPYGAVSRLRLLFYRLLGMHIGVRNRLEAGRIRRCSQIAIGDYNAFSQGWSLWPEDNEFEGIRIKIGDFNYFNKNVTLDACGFISLGSHNMIGPGTFITDSNHTTAPGRWVSECPMDVGTVSIGDGCWIGANVAILRNVTLGDRCIVAANSVVTQSFDAGSTIGGNPARLVRREKPTE